MKYIFFFISGLLITSLASAQNRVGFKVSDEKNKPLVGANILMEGTSTGAITKVDGIAQFDNVPDGKVQFIISFIGFETHRVFLEFPRDNNKTMEVELEEGEELEEVIISATRSSRTIDDIPTRIEVITGEELGEKAAMNSSNIGMLLRETTGVQMQQTSLSSGNLNIRIQGLDGRYTQILKDGFPLYGGLAGGLSIMQIPPLDLKQVELIKGSNSTLYGGGAIAGLVNLVPILPEEDPQLSIMMNQTRALGTTGNVFYAQKFGKTGLTVYGSVNNQFAYDPDDDGFSNIPRSHTFNMDPKFFYYIDANTELSVGLTSSVDKRSGGDMEVLKGEVNDQHQFSEVNKSERYSTQIKFQSSKTDRTLTLKNCVSYFKREIEIPGYHFDGTQYSGFSEFLYNLHMNDEIDWQFGANHYFEKFRDSEADNLRDYTHNTLGGFIQNTSNITDKFTFEGGLRADYNNDYGAFWLPRVSLLYKPGKNVTFRLGAAIGYKIPTMFTEEAEKSYFRRIEPLSPENLKPEKSNGLNMDINYKTVIFDEITFSANQMFFLTRLKNSLVMKENEIPGNYFFESADGDILSTGFETNLKLGYRDFKIYLNYANINTELQYDNINNQKPFTPRHNAGFVFMYEVEDKWSAGYELYYTGTQFDETFSQKPNYWVMGVMVMRYFKRLSLFINFENFTNVIQSDYESLVIPPKSNPTFRDIWAPTDGFVFNGGLKFTIF